MFFVQWFETYGMDSEEVDAVDVKTSGFLLFLDMRPVSATVVEEARNTSGQTVLSLIVNM
eukprot:CCRYP_012294-RA/>CCRYP_012294-RA protein AED:0.36 eAED:0.43 QI:0/0/0.5/1/0/0/2/239/59